MMEKLTESFDDLFSASLEKSDSEARRLDVVKMEYVGSESITWRELFSGYDSIKAITFSSGIGFVYQLLDMFKENLDVNCVPPDVVSMSIDDYETVFLLARRKLMAEKIRKYYEAL